MSRENAIRQYRDILHSGEIDVPSWIKGVRTAHRPDTSNYFGQVYYDPFRNRDARFKLFADMLNMAVAPSEILKFLMWGMDVYPQFFENANTSKQHVYDMLGDVNKAVLSGDTKLLRPFFQKTTFNMNTGRTEPPLTSEFELQRVLEALRGSVLGTDNIMQRGNIFYDIPYPPFEELVRAATKDEEEDDEEEEEPVPRQRKLSRFRGKPEVVRKIEKEQRDKWTAIDNQAKASRAGYDAGAMDEIAMWQEMDDLVKRGLL